VKPALASENMFVQALTRGEKEKENHEPVLKIYRSPQFTKNLDAGGFIS
jgi:hypothetical protein